MNILELDSYNLADAVKFHNRLNPRLWDTNEHLRPEVQSRLQEIAEYFQEFLGVPDLDVQDITISGSNAAYSYTRHSDIDLHLVVNMPPDPVYQELFNAKKYEFNDTHNIKIGGAEVELYVQPADQAHHSQGIYSVKNNEWIQVPQRKRAKIDDACVRDKTSDLDARIHRAIKSGDAESINALWQKIRNMRQAGLEQQGEFGCENITFKLLRNNGCIQKLKTARDQARDSKLSLAELARPKQRVHYGFGNGEVAEASLADMRAAFQSELKPLADPDKEKVYRSRDEYLQAEKLKAKQQEIAKALVPVKHKPWSGGVYESPDGVDPTTKMFLEEPATESPDGVNPTTAMFLTEVNTESVVQDFIQHTADQLGIQHMPEIIIHHDEDWSESNHSFGMYVPERHELHVSLSNRHLLDVLRTTAHELCHCAQHELEPLPDNAGDTGSSWENEAHAVAGVIMRDFADAHPEYFQQDAIKESASGYIPTKAQAQDSRYSMALTVDIKPGQVGKEANKLNLKTDRQGRPGLLMKTANLQESLAAEFAAFSEGNSYGYGSTPLSQVPGEREDDLNNQEATGPEFPPQWPAGTTKIDVSDLTDWYRLGMDISDLDDAKPEDYNRGPPQTVVVFPSDEAEQGYLKQFKRLGLKTHDMDADVKGGEDKTGKHLHQKLAEEFELFEQQDLFEINMGSKNLRKEAAKTGAIAGMEFEMIVPNVEGGSGDADQEPDYDYDQRCRSIQDAYDFFYDGDWNSRRSCDEMRDSMRDNYTEWLDEKIASDWDSQGEEYIYQWVKENVDESEWNPEDKSDLERTEALEEYATNIHADPMSDQYQSAYEEFREENQESYDESDWLDDADLSRMSEIENAYSMSWPHWSDPQSGGEASIEDVAQEFENAIGRDVRASGNYHSGSVLRPSPTQIRYVVEPDGSLEPDDPNDQGLEFVSPPLPIDEILSDLNKVRAWAKEYGCYTNDSTGLHINISVPDYSREKLDFVKLALLMGDKYVLDAFGRSSNTYAKSALDIVKRHVRDNPEGAAALLDKMKGNLDQLASKAIHSGITSKYTSINTKDGHIEFRSPGGDWLGDNFDQIENTLLRFTVAMSAALNPEAYRQEYLTKLYKMLTENNRGDDTIKYFSDYVAGKIPKAALRSFVKQAQLQRNIRRGKTPLDASYAFGVRPVADSGNAGQDALPNSLRPTGPGPWEIYNRQTGNSVQSLNQNGEPITDRGTAQHYAMNSIAPSQQDLYGVRTIATGSRANIGTQTDMENRLGLPSQSATANYAVVDRQTLDPVFRFRADDRRAANRMYGEWLAAAGLPQTTEDYGFQEIRPQSGQTSDRTDGSNINYSFRDLFGNNATADQQQGGIVDVAPDVAQNFGGEFSGQWRILDGDTGTELFRFRSADPSQAEANRLARLWLQQNAPDSDFREIEVVPVMSEGLSEGISPDTIHKLADRKGIKWDNEPSFLALTKRLTGKEHLDDLDQAGLKKVKQYLDKQGVAEGSEQEYLSQVPNLTWKPVSRGVWNTIQDEGLDEEQDAPSHTDWVMASLSIDPKDAQALQAFDSDAIEDFNRFDIHLKSRYPGLTDLIDYDRGTVTIVRTIQMQGVAEESYGNHPSQRVDPRTGKKYVPPKSPLKQGVAEAFDQPGAIEWETSEGEEAVDAIATLDDGTYLSIMFSKEFGDYGDDFGDWSIEFHRNNSQKVTGEGHAQQVFATVLEAIRQFVKKYQANTITFSASKEPEPEMVKPGANANPKSRAKLYNRLVHRYAGAMGYTATQREGNGKVTYTLRRAKQGMAEGKTLAEIEPMPAHQFTGGKAMLDYMPPPTKKHLKPLPGGTDLLYAVETMGPETRVQIVDPGIPGITRPDVVAALNLDPSNLPNTVQVGSITVDEDYRGRGLAKSLYGIVLTIMRKNLVSGSGQTPGGRKNWMSLAAIPGVEVHGLVRIPNQIFDLERTATVSQKWKKYADRTMDQIMQLGGQFYSKDGNSTYWLFDVVPGKGQLQPAVRNSLSRLYGYDADNLLLARWSGA